MLLDNQDFEDVYHQVLTSSAFDDADRSAINLAMSDAFEHIDQIVRDWAFSQSSPHPVNVYGLQKFIERFSGSKSKPGFFFTLNQDLFLERHYFNGNRPTLPGIQQHPDWFSSHWCRTKQTPGHRRALPASADPADLIKGHDFMYLKLHGSSNWVRADGSKHLVIGRHKAHQILEEPLLRAYWDIFCNALSGHDKKLFVIGYGFGDPHVNEEIAKSVSERQLRLYILSPSQSSQLRTEICGRAHGDQIWKGLGAHFRGRLIDLFPADQTETAMWREIHSKFFDGGA